PGQGRAAGGEDAGAGGLHDAAVGDAGGADGLAVAALEAEVQVGKGARRGLDALLRDRPYQVEPPAGRLRLEAGLGVGGAVLQAEAAAASSRAAPAMASVSPGDGQAA